MSDYDLITDYELINYLLDNHTIGEATIFFNCSRSYIMKRLKTFRENPDSNEILKEKLRLALLKNSLRGQKNGGRSGRKEQVITDTEAMQLKIKKEEENLSYRDLEQITGISYSTIRNAILRVSAEETEETGRGR